MSFGTKQFLEPLNQYVSWPALGFVLATLTLLAIYHSGSQHFVLISTTSYLVAKATFQQFMLFLASYSISSACLLTSFHTLLISTKRWMNYIFVWGPIYFCISTSRQLFTTYCKICLSNRLRRKLHSLNDALYMLKSICNLMLFTEAQCTAKNPKQNMKLDKKLGN